MADRIWQAGWELFREVGLYNTDTHRIIRLSDEEITGSAVPQPRTATGSARARMPVLWNTGSVEDTKPPFCIMSPDCTCSKKLFYSYCLAYLKEPLLDGFCAPILEDVDGSADPIGQSLRDQRMHQHIYKMRLAAKQVGRPGDLLRGRGHRRARRRPDRRVQQ